MRRLAVFKNSKSEYRITIRLLYICGHCMHTGHIHTWGNDARCIKHRLKIITGNEIVIILTRKTLLSKKSPKFN